MVETTHQSETERTLHLIRNNGNIMGRTLGYILLGVAAVALILIAAVMFSDPDRSRQAAILGFAIFTAVIVLPLAGAGAFMLVKGQGESQQMDRAKKQRRLLGIVKAKGQIDIDEVAVEIDSSMDDTKSMLYDLVDKGLYSGYINWDIGTLYSEQASQLHELKNCRNCQGNLELAGKGVITCPFCGTEYFLSK